jgi:uncharacterized protein
MSHPPELKNLYREGRLVPFLGAGVSMSVEWTEGGQVKRGPSWRELVDQAARILGFDEPDLLRVRGTDLQILEYFRSQFQGSATRLTNWLLQHMNAPDTAIQAAPMLTELSNMHKCSLFYTTNFDDFIERAIRLQGRPCSVVAAEGDMGIRSGEAEVVKFHGDLNHPDRMVLSESDYEHRLTLSTAMDYRLRSDVLGRSLLFIGYSFRDWNVAYLFRLVNAQFGELPRSIFGKRAYIVISDPSDFERNLFAARRIEVVPVGGGNRTQEIADLLREIRS